MYKLKEEVYRIIESAKDNPGDRNRWLGSEVAELGLKYSGLDDIPLNSVSVMTAIYTYGELSYGELLKKTNISVSDIGDYIDLLSSEYRFIEEDCVSGKYHLTDEGQKACKDIFHKVVIRKKLVLKGETDRIERIYSRLSEL